MYIADRYFIRLYLEQSFYTMHLFNKINITDFVFVMILIASEIDMMEITARERVAIKGLQHIKSNESRGRK